MALDLVSSLIMLLPICLSVVGTRHLLVAGDLLNPLQYRQLRARGLVGAGCRLWVGTLCLFAHTTTTGLVMPQNTLETVNELIAGSFGGAAQVLVGQPLDTIKTRAQIAPSSVSFFYVTGALPHHA